MHTTDEIAKEKQRVGEALARIDAEREKLTGELADLETTERVLARYTKGTRVKRTGSATKPATKAAVPSLPARRQTTAKRSADGRRTSPTLGDRVLVLATGKTQQEIAVACVGARPNHVGVVIARHKRAGRIEERDGKLYAAQLMTAEQTAAI